MRAGEGARQTAGEGARGGGGAGVGGEAVTGGPATAFRRLGPAARLRLAAEIALVYARVRWAMRRQDLPTVVAALRGRGPARIPVPLADAGAEGRRLGAAVVRTLEPTPFDSRCLMRSLVLLRLLVRRGGDGALVIAARPDEGVLTAHAWVEDAGRPLLAPAGADLPRLVAL